MCLSLEQLQIGWKSGVVQICLGLEARAGARDWVFGFYLLLTPTLTSKSAPKLSQTAEEGA